MGGLEWGGSPPCRVISHCFAKIAASDDGNFILPPHEAEVREGRRNKRRKREGRGGEEERR